MKLPPVTILSDLDGTLIDSQASVTAAFRWWAKRRGFDEAVLDRIPFGRSSSDAAAELAPWLDAEAEGRLLDRRQETHTQGVVALEGARALLEAHEPLAIVTSCTRSLALARLLAAGLPTPRTLMTTECWSRGKPDPEPYLCAARVLGVAPEDCVVLEDAPAGVWAGVRAGMQVVGLLTTHSERQLAPASLCIRTLAELPEALQSLLALRQRGAANRNKI